MTIPRYYVQKGLIALTFSFFAALAGVTFGKPLLFDRIFIAFICLCIFINRDNVDVIGVLLIVLIGRSIEELTFFLSDLPFSEIFIYLGMLYLSFKCKYDKYVKHLVFPISVICLLASIYWSYVDYPAPTLHFYIALLAQNVLLRHLVFNRVPLTRLTKRENVSFIPLDWQLYNLLALHIILNCILIAEYLIRHLTALSPLYVYGAYPEITQVFNILFLLFLSIQVINLKFFIKA